MQIDVRQIANPIVEPDRIIPAVAIESLPDSIPLQEFKDYLGVSHDGEDNKLTAILLAIINELAHPTSIGLVPYKASWSLSLPLMGNEKYVYLPRLSGTFKTLGYDADGKSVEIDWAEAPIRDTGGNINLIVANDALPAWGSVTVTWGVGYADRFPGRVKQAIFMWAGFVREFPLGVGDMGQALIERPPAVDLVLAEWGYIRDLNHVFGRGPWYF